MRGVTCGTFSEAGGGTTRIVGWHYGEMEFWVGYIEGGWMGWIVVWWEQWGREKGVGLGWDEL